MAAPGRPNAVARHQRALAGQLLAGRHFPALQRQQQTVENFAGEFASRDPMTGADCVAATRGEGCALIRSAQGRKFSVRPRAIGAAKLRAWRYNPRTGSTWTTGEYDGTQPRALQCPSEGFGGDWVLVLDDAARGFAEPGRR